jgi:CBS domain-containing protein
MNSIKDIMNTKVKACSHKATLAEAAALILQNDCALLPVIDEAGKLTGIITEHFICATLALKKMPAQQIAIEQLLCGTLFACSLDDSSAHAREIIELLNLPFLPVVDRNGSYQGIVSLIDLLAAEQHRPQPPDYAEDYSRSYFLGFTRTAAR